MLEDKLSMAHGLETRVPLLDNELIDFCWTSLSTFYVVARQAKSSSVSRCVPGCLTKSMPSQRWGLARQTPPGIVDVCGPGLRKLSLQLHVVSGGIAAIVCAIGSG